MRVWLYLRITEILKVVFRLQGGGGGDSRDTPGSQLDLTEAGPARAGGERDIQ